jgi:hypothetical protein
MPGLACKGKPQWFKTTVGDQQGNKGQEQALRLEALPHGWCAYGARKADG